MKKIFCLIMVLLIVLVSGCNNKSEYSNDMQLGNNDDGDAVAENSVKASKDYFPELNPEIEQAKTRLRSELISGSKIAISKGFYKANVGEIVALVIGIRNDFTGATVFRPEIQFLKAYDSMNNVIESDKEIMLKWLRTESDKEISLGNVEIGFLTVYFEIKDEIKAGSAVKKGDYAFIINPQYGKSSDIFLDYGGSKQFVIQVQ